MNMKRNMKRRGVLTIAALLLALGVAACGKPAPGSNSGGGGSNTVPMGPSTFSIASLTVKAGQTVHFDDSNGGYHVLCIGKDQQCTANAQGPAVLTASGGHTINVPNTLDVVFATAGTYEVTCTVHQNMNVTITVTP